MRKQICEDNDIGLADYFMIIFRRKWTVVIVFAVCITAAVVLSLLSPRIYLVDSTVRIGSIGGSAFVVEEIIERAKSRDSLESVVRGVDNGITVEGLKGTVIINRIKGTNFLKLSMESADPETAKKILDKIGKNLVLDGNTLYGKNISLIQGRIQELNARKESIGRQIKILDQKISDNGTVSDYPLIQNTLTNYETIYNGLSAAEYSLKKDLLLSEDFKIIEAPARSETPVKPKRKQIVAISAISGLMIGVFIAFFTEFWQKSVKIVEPARKR